MGIREDSSRVIVHKYGGSSVSTSEKIKEVARRVVETRRAHGDGPMVIVVSAMGKTTNQLLDLARDVTDSPCLRELDMLLSTGERVSASLLSMALKEAGVDAISLSGSQAGIRTDDAHSNATVLDVRPARIEEELARGRVVVIAGYQGANDGGEVTTLGRGGSDTSAVAYAVALGAHACHVCSDVDGVYTADPRIVPSARRLAEISYEEMLEMSRAGAHVLHPKAVELAAGSDLVIVARATFSEGAGTRIHAAGPARSGRATSVAGHRSVLRLVGGEGLGGGARRALAAALEEHDVLFGNVETPGVEFVVSTKNVPKPEAFAGSLREQFPGIEVVEALGTASVVGLGLGSEQAAERRAAAALRSAGIESCVHFATHHAITFVVAAERVGEALRALHREFLEEGASDRPRAGDTTPALTKAATAEEGRAA